MNFLILQECQNLFQKNDLIILMKDNIKLLQELDKH